MLKNRIIPCLLLSNGGLVKTKKFANPKYIGDPVNTVRIFNSKEVDELIVLDISATKEKIEPDYTIVEELASECFMPLCYGGGIHSLKHAKQLFSLGVEKISLQSAVLENTKLISEVAYHYGSQSIVVSVDLKKSSIGGLRLYSYIKRKSLKISFLDFLKDVVNSGAGEVLINYVDRDGMYSGMDHNSIKDISRQLPVPMIAMGGASSLDDIKKSISAGASAVAAGSLFVYYGSRKAVLINYPEYRELEMLLKDINFY